MNGTTVLKMGQEEIKELFFENPEKQFYLRQIARLTKTPKTTCSRVLNKLVKEKIISRAKSEPVNLYSANTLNQMYLFYKKQHILEKMAKSGLIEFIEQKTICRAIILFGSCSKAEYDKDSDIDLFVLGEENYLNLKKFKLKHKINLHFSDSFQNISEELKNNILNGDKLYGYLRWTDAI